MLVAAVAWLAKTHRGVDEAAPGLPGGDGLPSALRLGIAASRAGDLVGARELLESCVDLAEPAIRSRAALELALINHFDVSQRVDRAVDMNNIFIFKTSNNVRDRITLTNIAQELIS